MRKKKIFPAFEKVEIIDTGADGKAVAKVDNFVIFVKGGVPGDIVDVQIVAKKKNFGDGKITHFHTLSDKRQEPFCEHFGVCGGCKWQNMNYETQLFYKQKQVNDSLQRLAKIDISAADSMLASAKTDHYRNKLEYTFSNKRWLLEGENENPNLELRALGFHIPGRFDKVLQINTCHLQAAPSNKIRNEIYSYALKNKLEFFDLKVQQGLLRNLIIRNSNKGDLMVLLSFFRNDEEEIKALLSHLQQSFPEITSLLYTINDKKNDTIHDREIITFFGKDFIEEQMENLVFRIGPKSFYQTNSDQAYQLYQVARDFAGLSGDELVYDLYTGTGTIANFVAAKARMVIGVEYVETAIEDAKINSQINGIANTRFFAGDMKDVLNDEFIANNGKPDVVITDPPRAGMHEDVVRKLFSIGAKKIVYVSCNPATQARDLLILKEKYVVTKIRAVDMFPHTHHIENVCLLELMDGNN